MTTFFLYENLDWPAVAELPREVPLLIPLGAAWTVQELASGQFTAADCIAAALGRPERVGVLPAIPYGWRGSGLETPTPVLEAFLANLLHGLQEDGFTRAYILAPEGGLPRLGNVIAYPQPEPPVMLSETEREKVVLIPIGHTEQHGYHLPLNVDTVIIEAIAQGTAARIPAACLSLPVMPYGVSTHRRSFAGTLNAGGRAFEDFYLAVIHALVQRGFDRVYLMSGHGGNCSFLTNVVKYAGERHPHTFCATAWLYLSGPQGAAALNAHRRSALGGMGHACELETALMLHLRPQQVHLERAVDETDFIATPSYFMDWVEGGALIANPPWYDDSRSGAYGAGSLATSEHGRLWLEAAIAEKATHVAEIHEQHRRREGRRASRFGRWG